MMPVHSRSTACAAVHSEVWLVGAVLYELEISDSCGGCFASSLERVQQFLISNSGPSLILLILLITFDLWIASAKQV